MRRAVLLLSAAFAGLLLGLGVNSSATAQDALGVHGTLENQADEPVAGVSISVFDAAGAEIATVESAEDGTWAVPLDAEGDYVVTIDESTLPDGLLVRNGKPELEVHITSDRTVLFPLDTQLAEGVDPGGEEPTGDTETGDTPGDATSSEDPDEAADGENLGEIEDEGGATRTVSLLFSGLHFGLMIALAAVGLSMVFGTTGLTNFAHGDLVTFGGVMALLFNLTFGVPVWIAAIAAVLLGAAFGWVQDWGLWSRLRKRGTGLVSMMIISIGVALLIRFATLFFVGGERQRYNEYVGQKPWDFGWLVITPKEVVTGSIALVVCIGDRPRPGLHATRQGHQGGRGQPVARGVHRHRREPGRTPGVDDRRRPRRHVRRVPVRSATASSSTWASTCCSWCSPRSSSAGSARRSARSSGRCSSACSCRCRPSWSRPN